MAANLYAKSIFGEDALANLSIEKPGTQGPDAPVIGHIRIRAKSQVRACYLYHLYQCLNCRRIQMGFWCDALSPHEVVEAQ